MERISGIQEAHGLAFQVGVVLRQRLQLRLSCFGDQTGTREGKAVYNYELGEASEETPGTSVFYKDADGVIYHTYSSYGRGGDILIGAHNFLDLTPKGRNETGTMDWVLHHDKYEDAAKACCHSGKEES